MSGHSIKFYFFFCFIIIITIKFTLIFVASSLLYVFLDYWILGDSGHILHPLRPKFYFYWEIILKLTVESSFLRFGRDIIDLRRGVLICGVEHRMNERPEQPSFTDSDNSGLKFSMISEISNWFKIYLKPVGLFGVPWYMDMISSS